MRLRMSQVSAKYQQLKSQRDLLSARLKMAQARAQAAGGRRVQRRWGRRRMQVVAAGLTLFLLIGYGLVLLVRPSAPAPTPRVAINPPAPAPTLAPGVPVDVLKLIDLDRDVVAGNWVFDQGGLRNLERNEPSHIEVPYDLPAEYDLTIQSQRIAGGYGIHWGLSFAGRPFQLVIVGTRYTTGLQMLDGLGYANARNETSLRRKYDSQEYVLQVRKSRIVVRNDEATVIDYNGDPNRLTLDPTWLFPNKGRLQISIPNSIWRIEKLTITPVAPVDTFAPTPVVPPVVPPRGPIEAKRILEHQGSVQAAIFSPDGKTILTGSKDGVAQLWNATTGRSVGQALQHEDSVVAVAFSPDGKTLLTGSSNSTARLWDATTGQPIGPPLQHEKSVTAVAFKPDGKTVLTGSMDGDARLWNAATGQPIDPPLLDNIFGVTAVAFSPNGKTVLAGSIDGFARQWNAATGQPGGPTLRNEKGFRAMAYSPDGKTILAASGNTARLWDATSGQAVGSLLQHDFPVMAVAYSPDGRTLLTGSMDKTARLWDASSGNPIGPPLQHLSSFGKGSAIMAVAFSPDGKTILTGGADRTARLWDFSDLVTAPTTDPHVDVLREPDRAAAIAVQRLGGVIKVDQETGRIESVRFSPTFVELAKRQAVSDVLMELLGRLKNIRTLHLVGTGISDQGLAHIRDLTQLEAIHVGGASVSDAGVAHLAKLTNLTKLGLNFTKVTGQGVTHLSDLDRLEFADLSGLSLGKTAAKPSASGAAFDAFSLTAPS